MSTTSSLYNTITQAALKTIALEAEAVTGLSAFVNGAFVQAIEAMHQCKGRIVLSGIGKSANIAQKIVSTLNSTGTPSLFMHAADAIHGDLGMVQEHDVVVIISKSGESPEIKVLLPLVKNFGNITIAISGNEKGFLALNSTYFINTTVQQEACPNNLAPTTSTTAQMVMGDAIAVALMELKGFKPQDFAKYHPGGNLGKRLYLKVLDVCNTNNAPKVLATACLKEVIVEISTKMLGATAVVNEANQVQGIITDGDLRRMLSKTEHFENILAKDICSSSPKQINENSMAIDALELMRNHNISQLIVVNTNNQYVGILHLHQLINEGII